VEILSKKRNIRLSRRKRALLELMKVNVKALIIIFSIITILILLPGREFAFAFPTNGEEVIGPQKAFSLPTIIQSSGKSNTTKQWHEVETWTVGIVVTSSFSFLSLLRWLQEAYRKQQDDENNILIIKRKYRRNKVLKKIQKLRKFLKMTYSTVLWSDILFLLENIVSSLVVAGFI
jgi:cyanate permease